MSRSVKTVTICIISAFLVYNGLYPLEINFREHNGTSAAVRSLLLPGWGQYYNEQKIKSYVFFAITIIPLGAGWYFYTDAEKTYKKYEEKGLINDPLYDEYENNLTTANILFILSAIAWGYNVVDAYLHGENYKRKYGLNIKLYENSTNLEFVYRF